MRQYEKIWMRLKALQECKIKCAPAIQNRVIKAVKKEKWMDAEYKDKAPYAELQCKKTADGLEFKLLGVPLDMLAPEQGAQSDDNTAP